MKRHLGFALKFLLSVALIAYMATTFDLGDAAQRITQADTRWLAAAVPAEEMDARALTAEHAPNGVDLVVTDVSFISLEKALPPALALARPGADLVALVKPQFEAGKEEVDRGEGVITDPAIHDRVREDVHNSLVEAGTVVMAWTASPLTGADGNREFLVCAVREVAP